MSRSVKKSSVALATATPASPEATAEIILKDELRREEFIEKVYHIGDTLAKKLMRTNRISRGIGNFFKAVFTAPVGITILVVGGPCGAYTTVNKKYELKLNELKRKMAVVTNKGIYFIDAEMSIRIPDFSFWGAKVYQPYSFKEAISYTKWKDVQSFGTINVGGKKGLHKQNIKRIKKHTIFVNDGTEHAFYVDDEKRVLQELKIFKERFVREWQEGHNNIVAIAV